MGKKRRGEKLERVLAELQKLKGEVKTLAKQQAGLVVQIDKLSAKKPAARPTKKSVTKTRAKPKGAAVARKASAASKRPVLVAPPDAAAS